LAKGGQVGFTESVLSPSATLKGVQMRLIIHYAIAVVVLTIYGGQV
jgi:hypothetical protein